jgi:hypothetical protein
MAYLDEKPRAPIRRPARLRVLNPEEGPFAARFPGRMRALICPKVCLRLRSPDDGGFRA